MGQPREPRWRQRCWCCGEHFAAVRETATYCSQRCRQLASRKRRGKLLYCSPRYFDAEFREPPLLLTVRSVEAWRNLQ